jgi:hypothetical protein
MLQFKTLYELLLTLQLYYSSHHHHHSHHTVKLPITPDVRITHIAASKETLCSDRLSSAVRQIHFLLTGRHKEDRELLWEPVHNTMLLVS